MSGNAFRLALDFQFVAPLEIDGNDLLEVLTLPGKKVVTSRSYPTGVPLDEALDDLWQRAGISSATSRSINGVLFTATINPYLGTAEHSLNSTRNMRAKLRSLIPSTAVERFGLYERNDDAESVELVMVVSVRQTIRPQKENKRL